MMLYLARYDFMRSNPPLPLPVHPFAMLLLRCLSIVHYSKTMLFTCTPTAYISLPTRPIECTFAVFLAVLEITLVSATVHPGLHTAPLHLTESEFTFVEFIQVCKKVFSEALELAIHEITFVETAVFPFE
jgi:hypothetical protein